MRALAIVVGATLFLGACAGGMEIGSPSASQNTSPEMRAMYLSVIRNLAAQGKPEAALAFLDDYDGKYPDDPEAREIRGDALLRVARRDEAAKVFRALDEDGYHAAAKFGLGQVSALASDWAAAAGLFEAAVRLAPTNVRYLNNSGYALLKTGKSAEAYRVLARTVELAPKDETARNNYILAAMRSGHEADAKRALAALGERDREKVVAFVAGWSP